MSATLTLDEAARFLGLSPEALRSGATAGVILGAKVGKCWWSCARGFVDTLRSGDARALVWSRR